MKCTSNYVDEETGEEDPPCDNEATHTKPCTGHSTGAVCAEHKCRCSFTLEEAARRRAIRVAEDEEKAGIALVVQGAMASYPAGLSCVRTLSHLTSDCAEAFGEPRCPQCRITAGVVKVWDARNRRDALVKPVTP